MYLNNKEKKKYKKSSLHPSERKTSPNKSISYTNSPPKNMTTLIPKTTPHFCHKWQRACNSSCHLVVTRRASILILILIIIVLILRCLWRRRRRLHEATKASLLSHNTTDIGVHLIQLITECVKVSIHALKLYHDRLKGHTTRRRRRKGCGWSRRCRRSHRLGLCFGQSWASLCRTITTSMAHMTEKCVDSR